jgi:hypothetical protein
MGNIMAAKQYQKRPLSERIWRRIEVRLLDECWLWQGCLDNFGYGHIGVDKKHYLAHRLAFEDIVGPIPDGAVLRHTCDTGACCNPTHLVVGTQQANIHDKYERKRDHQKAVITKEIVDTVEARMPIPHGTKALLAKELGITPYLIWKIQIGDTWIQKQRAALK